MEPSVDLTVQLAPRHPKGLLLANPVITSSGTFGYGVEFNELFDVQKLGAIVCKGTTLHPRQGNPQPRITETPCGVLNSIGFQNIGVKALVKEKAPIWATWRIPVIVNIDGDTADQYAEVAGELDGVPGISAVEINISCPNLQHGGLSFGTDPGSASAVTAAVRSATSLPILVKITAMTGDIVGIAQAVAEAGADALTIINTLKGMVIDIRQRRPLLGNRIGGLSGPAIKPVAVCMVYEVSGAVDIPVVGCGGITTADDAIEFFMAGASAVQVGAATFTNPCASLDILDGIQQFMKKEGFRSLGEIVGVARA